MYSVTPVSLSLSVCVLCLVSTRDEGQKPFSFNVGLGKVIAGWDEGCMTMKLGESARLTIDGSKGYGPSGFAAWGIPPNATLVFDIEVIKIGS